MTLENFKPVPRPRLGKTEKAPKHFRIDLNDDDLAAKFHEYCLKNRVSGCETILQLIKALVRG